MIRKLALAAAAAASVAALAFGPVRVAKQVFAQANPNVLVDTKNYQDLRWRSIGPFRGGRSTAATGVRAQPNVFYFGATGGGVWKTDNYGITWMPVSDGQIATGSIGAIAVADSDPNIVYVGTGSEAIRSNVIIGDGVWKSADAGKTWQHAGLENVGQIANVKINPRDPNIAFVAAVGNPFAWGPDRGVYRTRDGGKTWQKVLFINDQTGAVSIAINWSNPDEVYASAWRTQRRPWTIISGGPAAEGGVYKSTDGGDHWTRSSSGLPDDLMGKVWIDVAQSNPKVLYAQVEALGPKGGLYRSDDGAATWKLVNNSAQLRARPFYFNKVFVSPKNENEVWVTELGLHRSTDGGKTWTSLNPPHGDNHIVWFNPDNPRTLIETNDGGANVSEDGGRSWSSQLNQPTAELYMVDADERFPYRLYAPQQDDGTVVIDSLPETAKGLTDPSVTWFDASGCESGQIRPTPDGKIVYGDCKGEFGRYSIDTGQEQHFWINPQQRYGKNPKNMKFRFVRQAPIEMDPHNPKVVYHGSQFLHKTIDGGVHWTKISPDLTANEPDKQVDSGEPISRDMTGEEVYSALYAIRASRLEPGVIWTGSNDGPVWVTRNGGQTWKNVTPKGLPPGGRVHTIEDSPHRKGSAYVCVYRIYFGDFKPYLYLTNDYGEHWALLTDGNNGIPADQPMHVVREDPEVEGLLYAGTWYGAYVSFDNGKHFQPLQQNLPATPVTDLKVHHGDLLASTMGRSFWIMDDIAPLRQLALGLKHARTQTDSQNDRGPRGAARLAAPDRRVLRPDAVVAVQEKPAAAPAAPGGAKAAERRAIKPFDGSNVFLFTPAAAYRTHYNAISNRPDWPEYPPAGARIDYYLAQPSGEAKLEILDAAGKLVREYSSTARAAAPTGRGGGRRGAALPSALPTKAGMNRFVWDLRYSGSPAAADGEGGGFGGPLAPPGTYRARLTASGTTKTETFTVKIDPRYAKDGLTAADLAEQTKFALKVRDALAEGRQLAQDVRKALDAKTGDQARLQSVWDRLMNKPGQTAYEDKMWIDQMSNIQREVGIADQKVPASAYDRFNELTKELAAMKADAGVR
ncbi:MAG TPA: hypothetical protein VL309_09075 [Vicinamibacterales bacterium]|nr:hypothetical protein [Vicinamibacterales bacterium]